MCDYAAVRPADVCIEQDLRKTEDSSVTTPGSLALMTRFDVYLVEVVSEKRACGWRPGAERQAVCCVSSRVPQPARHEASAPHRRPAQRSNDLGAAAPR